jgi:hypothetical protein
MFEIETEAAKCSLDGKCPHPGGPALCKTHKSQELAFRGRLGGIVAIIEPSGGEESLSERNGLP